MKTVVCFLVAILSYSSIEASRLYYPEENDINYKLFQVYKTKTEDEKVMKPYADEVTVKADLSHVTYYLYTKNNLNSPQVIKSNNLRGLSGSPHFDPKKKTYFLIHGWVDDQSGAVNVQVRQALFKKHDVNVVVVDWSPVAAESYSTAKAAVTDIGKFVGNFINDIIDVHGLSGSSFTLVGHSLGAHIAGNAGSTIKYPVEHIIGLDPAAPFFDKNDIASRLDPSDAQYVQIIHTNGRFLGMDYSIGHVDYYPNGGMTQAGCGLDLLGTCSHSRAIDYLAEAIANGKFTATLCGSYTDYQNKKCQNNKKTTMGLVTVDKSTTGDYFLNTNSAAPFAQG